MVHYTVYTHKVTHQNLMFGEHWQTTYVQGLAFKSNMQAHEVMRKASGYHDPDPKDYICGHIPPQSPHWAPTWHYYNTGWPLGRWYGPGYCIVRTYLPNPRLGRMRRGRLHHGARSGPYQTTATQSEGISFMSTEHLRLLLP